MASDTGFRSEMPESKIFRKPAILAYILSITLIYILAAGIVLIFQILLDLLKK